MESLKTFLSDSKGYLQRIVGLADWRSEPSMSLEQVTTQTRAILGNMDQFAVPDIHLANASSQIAAIIGESDDAAVPDITLAATKLHVDTTPTTGTVHGITGWSTAPVALGVASAGSATTIARSDHVHPTTDLLTSTSALTTSQLGGTPVALGSVNQQGLSTKAAKSDHVHIYPTAANVGAMATTHTANGITALGGTPAALGSASSGSGTAVALSNHVHALPSLATLGAAAVAGSTTQAFSALNLTTDRVIVDTGTTGGMKGTGVSAIFGFGTSGSVAAVFCDSGLYVKNYANTAGTYTDVYAKDYYSNGVKVASDEKLKRGIRPLRAGDGLTALSSLAKNGVIHYKLKEDADNVPERLGFSAQQVAAASPNASITIASDDGEDPLLGWDVGAMMAMVVDAIGSLSDRLEALEKGQGRS